MLLRKFIENHKSVFFLALKKIIFSFFQDLVAVPPKMVTMTPVALTVSAVVQNLFASRVRHPSRWRRTRRRQRRRRHREAAIFEQYLSTSQTLSMNSQYYDELLNFM
jgi:hypothetical protein